jgi:hypothetical protein
MADIEITTELVPLTNPRALFGVIANSLLVLLDMSHGGWRAVDVIARCGDRVVGKQRAWASDTLDHVLTAMTDDAEKLTVEEFEKSWL